MTPVTSLGRMVLIIAEAGDETAVAVREALRSRPVEVAWIDLGDFPADLHLTHTTSRDTAQGRLQTPEGVVDLASVYSVFYHRPTSFRFPEHMSAGDRVFAAAEARMAFGGVLASLDAVWVNHPARAAVAEYKILQQQIARHAGLPVPRTIVTNDHAALVEFSDAISGPLVCKTLSPVVLGEHGQPRVTYTTPIEVADLDPAAVASTAHLIQEWVPKDYEARITMIGAVPFGVAIHAASDGAYVDWRSDYAAITYRPITPPPHITAAMACFLNRLGLNYGAFDFVVTPAGQWVMLECNPCGLWLWLNEHTDRPITAGFADLLTGTEPDRD